MPIDIHEMLQISHSIQEGHFLLTSGLHSPQYLEKFRILQSPCYTATLCKLIADHYENEEIDVVAGPTLGGMILAYETAK